MKKEEGEKGKAKKKARFIDEHPEKRGKLKSRAAREKMRKRSKQGSVRRDKILCPAIFYKMKKKKGCKGQKGGKKRTGE